MLLVLPSVTGVTACWVRVRLMGMVRVSVRVCVRVRVRSCVRTRVKYA